MKQLSTEDRQRAGCGYEPPLSENLRALGGPWIWAGLGYKGPKPTVCPGFSTNLPEVIEVARAKMHWEKGGPAAIGVTDWQEDPLGVAVEILAAAAGEHQEWRTTPAKNGGGAA